jgi:hypothetical protein
MPVEARNILANPRSPGVPIRAHPGQSPAHGKNKPTLHLLLLFVLSLHLPDVGAKEAVIFEQFGQLAGITAYLHVHVELSISSVEAQLSKYRQLLKQNCDSELAVLNYMLTTSTRPSATLHSRRTSPTGPRIFRKSP